MYKGRYEPNQTPVAPNPPRTTLPQETNEIPAPRTAPQPEYRTAPRTAPQPEHRTAPRQGVQGAPRRNPNRRPPVKPILFGGLTKGGYIFYGVYLAIVLVFFIGVAIGMGALKDWLIKYQAAQPEAKSQQVFQQLFANPDWNNLYAMANPDQVDEEVQAAYVEFMTDLVGEDSLRYIETSAGLSGDKKYIVCHKDIGIAIFTLTADNKDAEVPDWRLGSLQVFFDYKCCLSYNIVVTPGCTVTVNGNVLNDSQIVRTVSTKAEDYLPTGIHGYQLLEYRVTDLKSAPEVVVTDAKGAAVTMEFNEETNTYTQVLPKTTPIAAGDAEYDVVLGAAKAYTEYMIKGSTSGLKKYFDSSSTLYANITGGMIIRQDFASYKYEPEVMTEYYRYSDTLFSAKIDLVTKVTRPNGTIKEFEVDCTFIYQYTNGKWVVYDMVNVAIQEQITEVRLTYKDADNKVISSAMVNAKTNMITTPSVTVPEGQEFIGWFIETVDEQGNISLDFAFLPDSNNSVSLAGNTDALNPMVLVPQFKEAA